MGKYIRFNPFRRRRQWTHAADYGVRPAPRPAKFWREERPRKGGWLEAWRAVRVWALVIFLVTFWVLWRSPELTGAPDFLSTEPQQVDAQWTRCGYGRGTHCVIDGDSFKIGDQSYRVLGIDAPELEARCPAEAAAAEAATRALHDWLNAGAFVMQGRIDEPVDRYGRGLRTLYRSGGNGREYVSRALIDEGHVRDYFGGTRQSWC